MSHWKDFLDPCAPPGAYLPWKEVARRTSLSRTTAWRLQKRGEFPRPHAISPGRVAHLTSEVDAWIASRATSAAMTRATRPPTAGKGGGPQSREARLSTATPVTSRSRAQRPVGTARNGSPAQEQITFKF